MSKTWKQTEGEGVDCPSMTALGAGGMGQGERLGEREGVVFINV